MAKQTNKTQESEPRFIYEIGSNVIKLNGETKYLNIIVKSEVTYKEIKENIVG